MRDKTKIGNEGRVKSKKRNEGEAEDTVKEQ